MPVAENARTGPADVDRPRESIRRRGRMSPGYQDGAAALSAAWPVQVVPDPKVTPAPASSLM
jgi:hypothetical protein